MTKIAMIRCEKNENTCPLTACIACLERGTQAFKGYDETTLVGVFTCRCGQDNLEDLARVLKSKGAEVIHVPTCLFANKVDGRWVMEGGGLCRELESVCSRIREASGLPCVEGTAHLPEGFVPAR